jgi:hypothetical protein
MNSSLILTILGLAATLIFGLISIYLIIQRRYPGRITFIREASIGLFDSIVRNVPELSVLYNGKPVSENLVLLKGILQNTGSVDITEMMVVEPLAIKLPEGYKWLEARIVGSAPNVHATVSNQDSTSLIFDVGLFRVNEHIRFEAVAEVPSTEDASAQSGGSASDRLSKVLIFSHRIANTQKVNSEMLPPRLGTSMLKPRVGSIVALSLNIFIMAACIIWLAIGEDYSPKDIYLIRTNDARIVKVRANDNGDGTKTLKGIDNDYSERLSDRDFYLNRYVELFLPTPRIRLKGVAIILLYSLILTLFFATPAYVVVKRRTTRLNNLLKE